MEIRELLKKYLQDPEVMQLATVTEAGPWLCTVHYSVDDNLNFYWLSLPGRRHSVEATADPRAAVAVVVKQSMPVIGVQAEGVVSHVTDLDEAAGPLAIYEAKHESGRGFYENMKAGTNQHQLYKFTPSKIVLFDEVDFPDNGRQELVC